LHQAIVGAHPKTAFVILLKADRETIPDSFAQFNRLKMAADTAPK
jgi:hypothetical protein